jgi:xanthine/CO dehydrogenase XdhC/CoxF family maturation factor
MQVNNWLETAKRLANANTAFVLATIWRKSGYSPDAVGARLIVSAESIHGELNSDNRHRKIVQHAKQLLQTARGGTIERYPLGRILGSENGTYDVVFALVAPGDDAAWLVEACRLQRQGSRFVLAQHLDTRNKKQPSSTFSLYGKAHQPADPTGEMAIQMLMHQEPAQATELLEEDTTQTLIQVIGEPVTAVAVLGDSRVADCLVQQLLLLPLSVYWLAPEFTYLRQEGLIKNTLQASTLNELPGYARLVIATGNHENDLLYCELALQSAHFPYVGCIGSAKKAAIIKTRLAQSGVPQHRVDQLKVPVGLPSIKGKQAEIVAASIVAQLLAFKDSGPE